jgi:Tol biopolymer transport system component
MKKVSLLCGSLMLILALSSCSGQLDREPAPTSTLQLNLNTTSEPDPVPDPGELPTVIPTNAGKIPVTWSNLHLQGKLFYNFGAVDQQNNYIVQIQSLDLATGDINVIYRAIPDAWIYYISASPGAKAIVMSYSPPLQSDPHVVQALYGMPWGSSQPPQLLFLPPTREDEYTQAEWSPDGTYIYYTYVNYLSPNDPNRLYPQYKIFRMKYPQEGQPKLIADKAYWPRLSSDGLHLVYVSLDPSSGEEHLKVADGDGGNAKDVALFGPYIPQDKTTPFFSPDGKSILFSGSVPDRSYRPEWYERILGMENVHADGQPSDWWSVPVGGGEVTRLTHLYAAYLYGSPSPDGKHVVSYGGNQMFVMNPDGSEQTVLISGLFGFNATLSWIP